MEANQSSPAQHRTDAPARAETPAITAPEAIAAAVEDFIAAHPEAAVFEDGRAVFDLRAAKYTLSTEHGRCTLHLWSGERSLVRTLAGATPKANRLRLATVRFGHANTKLLEFVAERGRKLRGERDQARTRYVALLERVLGNAFNGWKPDGFRTAMDLEASFGPAYARGSLVRGNQAWAVVGVNHGESGPLIDGVLTAGILWLHACRERAAGRRLYGGLRVIVPKGTAVLTLARMAWLDAKKAAWELYELDEKNEELVQRELDDTGNLRTRLVHHPDEAAARERFAAAIEKVMELVPAEERERVDLHLRSAAELAFLLHGLEFARARLSVAQRGFKHAVEVTVGVGAEETAVDETTRAQLAEFVRDLFARRTVRRLEANARRSSPLLSRRIGATQTAAHSRLSARSRIGAEARNATQDPLYRAAPERWLESVLRRDLAPLTRGLAGEPSKTQAVGFVDVNDEDNVGNRAEPAAETFFGFAGAAAPAPKVIPRFDPRFAYAQVPAIAGASDRGLLDLLGVTVDGRLAVIELKAAEDLHFALQGLDYWIRVRHHHCAAPDSVTGMDAFHRHGYFPGVELSPLPPRLYLVAPALHVHPATEIVLRYFSSQVEWQLLALDEHWREKVRVAWRKSSVTQYGASFG